MNKIDKPYVIITIHRDHTFSISEERHRPKNAKHLAQKNLENIKRIVNENMTYKALNKDDPYVRMEKAELIGVLEEKSNYIKDRFKEKFKTKPWIIRYLYKDLKHNVKSISHYVRTKNTPLMGDKKSKLKKIQTALKDIFNKKILPKKLLVYEKTGFLNFHKRIDVKKTVENLAKSSLSLSNLLSDEIFYETNNYKYLLEYLTSQKGNITEKIRNNVLFLACENGDEALLKLAIKLKPDFNAIKYFDNIGLTPLLTALLYNRDKMAMFLLENEKVDVNVEMKVPVTNKPKAKLKGDTALHLAVIMGKEWAVGKLIQRKCHINARNTLLHTPLYIAVDRKKTDIAKMLLENHADPNISDNFGMTPLHLAARQGNLDLVKYLVESQAGINARNTSGLTPLDQAKDTHVKDYLVLHGAKKGKEFD